MMVTMLGSVSQKQFHLDRHTLAEPCTHYERTHYTHTTYTNGSPSYAGSSISGCLNRSSDDDDSVSFLHHVARVLVAMGGSDGQHLDSCSAACTAGWSTAGVGIVRAQSCGSSSRDPNRLLDGCSVHLVLSSRTALQTRDEAHRKRYPHRSTRRQRSQCLEENETSCFR